jgi:hypothetical protein
VRTANQASTALPGGYTYLVLRSMPPSVPDPLPKYSDRLNFQELSEQDPKFAQLLKSNDGKMDWQDGRFVRYI